MIIDYPDSKPSFQDLQSSLSQTNLRQDLIKVLKQVYENRILHPGIIYLWPWSSGGTSTLFLLLPAGAVNWPPLLH